MKRRIAALAAAALWASPAAAWSPPKRQAEPKMRDCPEIGAGYARVPGTDTCVKLGGLVRVEAMKQGGGSR